jgi:DNA-binding transcriptional MocR family regulator
MDDQGIRPDDFTRACRAGARFLYTTPTLQNPTGVSMSAERRVQLALIAGKYDVQILEDDVYGFLAPDAPLPIAAIAPERSYYIQGVSKSVAPGFRVGYVAAPEAASARVSAAVRTTVWETTPLAADVLARWMRSGTIARIVEGKRKEMAARRALAASIFGAKVPAAGMCPHLWLSLPEGWRPQEFAAACRERGVGIGAGERFAVDESHAPRAFRVCLGAVRSRGQVERGLREVAELLGKPPERFSVT